MAAKPRRIQIDTHVFLWKIDRATPSAVRLRLWREGMASTPWAEVLCRFDDAWLNCKEMSSVGETECGINLQREPLKPKQVAEIIRMVMPRAESLREGRNRRFELLANGELAAKAGNAPHDRTRPEPITESPYHLEPS